MLLSAHAKVNLGLSVIARRGDGFHELESIMAKLSLADDVTVRLNDSGEITVTTTFSEDLPAGSTFDPDGVDNICATAAQAYLTEVSSTKGVDITLHKRIPSGAGLAGGSSDAGAALRALQTLIPSDTVDVQLIGASIGSDVPFHVSEYPAALARGRGERLRDLPRPLPQLHLVLVNPGFEITAKFAYDHLLGFTPRLKTDDIITSLEAGISPRWPNALQPGIFKHFPELRALQRKMQDHELFGVLLSGSGPTLFGIAQDAEHAGTSAETLRAANPELWVQTAHTL